MSLPVTPGCILGLAIICVTVSVSVSSSSLTLPNSRAEVSPVQVRVPSSNHDGGGSTVAVEVNRTQPYPPPPLTESEKPTPAPPDKNSVKVEEILQQIFQAEFEDEALEMQSDAGTDGIPEVTSGGQVNLAPLLHHSGNVTQEVQDQRQGRGMEFDENNRQGRGRPRPGRQDQRRRNQNNRNRQNQNVRNKFNGGNRRGAYNAKNKKGPNRNVGGNRVTGQGNNRRELNLAKYNAYMDAVLTRMNALIRKKRMDPLRVNLYAGAGGGGGGQGAQNKNKNKQGQRKGQGGKTKKKGAARWEEEEDSSGAGSDDEDDGSDSSEVDEEGRSVRDFTLLRSNAFQRKMRALAGNATEDEERAATNGGDSTVEASPDASGPNDEGRGKVKSNKPYRKPNKSQGDNGHIKGQTKRPATLTEEDELPSRPPKKRNNSPRPTRGVLHGLSSLRRDGNVQIIRDGEKARIIRSRFLLGPVALEILPKKTKKKSSREDSEIPTSPPPPAATATAPELKGILEIRLSPGKPTRIRKLRVFPPGNIEVGGDKKSGNQGMKRAGYRKVTPMATARLRQTAVQVLRQVDNKMKNGGKLRQGMVES